MIKAKMTKTFNWKNIKFDLSEELNDGRDLIAKNIQHGIERGAQFNKPLKRNAPATVKKKGFDHPLKETGLLMDSKKMIKQDATKTRQIATLLPNERRIDIAYWHNEGEGNPKREHWGISKDAERKIMTMMKNKIKKILDSKSRFKVA